MKHSLTKMLGSIEHNITHVPADDRATLEPLIGAMNAGQVTAVPPETAIVIHRVFLLHCLES
jgi:hypothetical protein